MAMKISAQANAAILLRVAVKTRKEARSAWLRARSQPNEKTLRSAYRACVLASRTSHRAAKAWAHDAFIAHRLIADAKKLDASAAEFKDRLVETALEGDP